MNDNAEVKRVKISVVILLCVLFSLIFGVGGWLLGTKMANIEGNKTNIDGNKTNTQELPDMNSNYTFLNSLKNEKDGIEVVNYYYLDKESLNTYDYEEEKDVKKDFFVLRGETFVNNKRIGDIRILDVLDEKLDKVTNEHFSINEINSVSDTKNDDKYYFITLENNNSLISDGTKIEPYSEVPTYVDLDARRTYLVTKDGNVLKEFEYGSCWLRGIVLFEEEIEDRYYIETDYDVYDDNKEEYVAGFGKVIYPDGRYFDVHDDYFYWLDRHNGGNEEYKFYIENGVLKEQRTRLYGEYRVGIMDVNCVE